jgi:hypothetical protein
VEAEGGQDGGPAVYCGGIQELIKWNMLSIHNVSVAKGGEPIRKDGSRGLVAEWRSNSKPFVHYIFNRSRVEAELVRAVLRYDLASLPR